MTTPPFLLGAALAFWGWQTGLPGAGALLAALCEAPRVIKARWSFSQADFDRLWNITTILFLGAAVYLYVNEGSISLNDFFVDAGRRPEAIAERGRAALVWFQWFPMLFAPFVLAALFSTEQTIEVSTFSWFMRKRRATRSPHDEQRVNVAFPYFAVTLLAAGTAKVEGWYFYAGLCAVMGWAFWCGRERRFSLTVWAMVLLAVLTAGYGAQRGIWRAQRALEEMNVLWFTRVGGLAHDTRQTRTAIGMIGRLKMSDSIVLRLRTDGQPPPELLREASYNAYRSSVWANTNKDFTTVFNDLTNALHWPLLPGKKSRRAVNVACYLPGGGGVLPAPTGVSEIDRLPTELLERNSLGVLRTKGAPGLALYDVHYDERGATIDGPPQEADLVPFEDEEPGVQQVARELGLEPGMPPREAMRRVAVHFQKHFNYSSWLTGSHVRRTNETALTRFLLKERAGHCEYFATSAALLLRHAGVPARYAVGFSVQEGAGRKWVVRERHAHAWTLVYLDGVWQDFDTTPAGWNSIEALHTSSFIRPIRDFFSDLWFQFSKWRWGTSEWRRFLLWIPLPLLLLAIASFLWRKQWRQMRTRRGGAAAARAWPGLDSEFYELERALAGHGLGRRAHESWGHWSRRVSEQVQTAELGPLVRLHCRYRFDPAGLSGEERGALRRGALKLVARLKAKRTS